jgi:hypothetical protein
MRGVPASREAVRRSRGVPGPLGHGASSLRSAPPAPLDRVRGSPAGSL